MKFAYADPPYLGMGKKLYGLPEWDDIGTHKELIKRLVDDYPDGWALSMSSVNLKDVLPLCPADCRVAAWVKPFASFKPGVNPAYTWEPVVFRGGRKHDRKNDTVRDYHSENIQLRKGLPGVKPPGFSAWIISLLNADVRKGDTITDLFHGAGGMLGVWRVDVDQIVAQQNITACCEGSEGGCG